MPRSPSRPVLAAYFSLAAVVGCGVSVPVATTSATGTGGASGTSDGGTGGGAGVGCYQCACKTSMSAGGCKDFCFAGDNPIETLFCDGEPARADCAACLAMNCPTADPNDPNTCM